MRRNKKRLYRIWSGMKARCLNPNCRGFKNYGGRGIGICKEWINSYSTFESWANSHGYNDTLSIDRIDNNGWYEPDNCRWITIGIQQQNKRTSFLVTYDGEKICSAECERRTGINRRLIVDRIKRGWSNDDAVKTPVAGRRMITFNGLRMSMNAWSRHLGLSRNTVRMRLEKGWTVERALSK